MSDTNVQSQVTSHGSVAPGTTTAKQRRSIRGKAATSPAPESLSHALDNDLRPHSRGIGEGTVSPHLCNTGGKLSNVTLGSSIRMPEWSSKSISIDWLRATHNGSRKDDLRRIIQRHFGHQIILKKGAWGYTQCWKHDNAAQVLFDPMSSEDTCCIDIPGSAINSLPPLERHQLLNEVILGCRKVTRLDLCLDLRNDTRVGLVDAVYESAITNNWVTGTRSARSISSKKSGQESGRTIYLGQRGSLGSGRFARFYDKGLETGKAKAGLWERFEVEFTSDNAHATAVSIAESDDWEREAFKRMVGAFDFRANGNQALKRRPRLGWWQTFIGAETPVRSVEEVVIGSLERRRRYYSSQMAPIVKALADETGLDVVDVMKWMCSDFKGISPTKLRGEMKHWPAELVQLMAS